MRSSLLILFSIVLLVFSCAEEPHPEEGPRPKVLFTKEIKGKQVEMVKLFPEPFMLRKGLKDIEVSFTSTAQGERLKVNSTEIDYSKAIKYKRYYFLHQEIDSSLYEIYVIGKYRNRYYGFENLRAQARTIKTVLNDSVVGEELGFEEYVLDFKTLIIDSLSGFDVVLDPSKRRVVKKFYKNYLKNSYAESSEKSVRDSAQKYLDEIETDLGNEELIISPKILSEGTLMIRCDLFLLNQTHLVITDVTGNVFLSEKVKGKQSVTFNSSEIPAGTYLVTVSTPLQSSTSKFSVVK